MIYQKPLTVPKNTPLSDPVSVVIQCEAGVITSLRVGFPPGCADMVLVWVTEREFQIVPAEAGTYIRGDDVVIDLSMDYELSEPPFELTAYAASPDTYFDHTLQLLVTLTPSITRTQRSLWTALFGG